MLCPYCGSEVGATGICDRCGAVNDVKLTGWRPDPTARHEGRYYVTGRPTNRVRDGRAKGSDPNGGRMLPRYIELPSPTRTSVRSTYLATGAATVIIVMLAAVAWILLSSRQQTTSPDSDYLAGLNDAGLAGQFNSDANALAHGKRVCRDLDDGGPQQGFAADKIAVDTFCPQFSQGFHTLETAKVSGTFVLSDTQSNTYVSAIASDGKSCEGTDGYGDISRSTQVTVKNGKGDILATTSLGDGHGNAATCTFSFDFTVAEGQDRYVVSVGRRGEFSYTFDQLQTQGARIRLGR